MFPATLPTTQNKRKRACDYCKLKRVICHPQPDGRSCPRCLEKGINCNTTILPRKPRGPAKKSAQSEAQSNSTSTDRKNAEAFRSAVALRNCTASVPPVLSSTISCIPRHLIQDAFEVCTSMMPAAGPGLVPLRQHRALLESCDWDIQLLAPQARVLTFCLLAIASLVSVDPSYIGYDSNGRRYNAAHLDWNSVSDAVMGSPDIRELGMRRQPICGQLYGEAVRQAHLDGITSMASRENAASCLLLNILDIAHKPNTTLPWATAFVWQLRSLSDMAAIDATFDIWDASSRDLAGFQWRVALVFIAISAIKTGKNLPFSAEDEDLICGSKPVSVEDAFEQASSLSRRDAVVLLMQSVYTRSIHLMRDALAKVVGIRALRNPPDDFTVLQHITAAEHHYEHLVRLRRFLHAYSAGPSLMLCLHSTSVAHCALTVAIYRALASQSEPASIYATDLARNLRKRARALARRAVVDAVEDVRNVVASHWLRFIQVGGFDAWAEVLLAEHEDDGQDGITLYERHQALTRLRDLLAFSQFIGIDGVDMLPAIDAALQVLSARLAQGIFDHGEGYDFDVSVGDESPSHDEIYSGGLAAPVILNDVFEEPTAWTVVVPDMLGSPAPEMGWVSQLPVLSSEMAVSSEVPTTMLLHGRGAHQPPDTSQWERWIQPVGST
ncbi:phosphoribosylglycinamide synthetase [Schizophyllum commune]